MFGGSLIPWSQKPKNRKWKISGKIVGGARYSANEIAGGTKLYSKIQDLYICKLLCSMANLSIVCLFEQRTNFVLKSVLTGLRILE